MIFAPLAALVLAQYAAATPVAAPVADTKHGSSVLDDMGPVTFLFPEVREWSADADNIAPCGSYANINNRTDFPLDDGFVAFIAKYISYNVKLSISYNSNPTTQDEFEEWYNGNVSSELHIGHTCFFMPDLPNSVNTGDVATIQAIYQNDDSNDLSSDGTPSETNYNETFYVCADVTFVEESVFDVTDYALSCFNATDDNYYAESSIDAATSVATYDSSQVSEVASARSSQAYTSTTSSSSSSTATSSSSSSTTGGAVGLVVPVSGAFAVIAMVLPAFL